MKICVAGQGAFGQKHLDALKRIQGVEVTSLVGGNQDSTAAIAKKYGVPHYTGDLSEGIKRADAVILTTPTKMHFRQAEQVMRAGKHVLVEIPVTDSVEDAENLVKIAKETGVTAMGGHVRRFNPSHQYVHKKIVAGELKIQQMDVQTYFFRRKNINAAGNARSWTDHLLWHHAAHTIDLFQYQVGENISDCYAVQGPIHKELNIAMDMGIVAKTPSGSMLTLSLSFNNDGPLGSFFRYICDNGTFKAFYDDLSDGKDNKIDVSKVDVSMDGIELEDREFIKAIQEKREPNGSLAAGAAVHARARQAREDHRPAAQGARVRHALRQHGSWRALLEPKRLISSASPRMRGPQALQQNWVPASAGTNGACFSANNERLRRGKAWLYSALIPAAFTTLPHFSVSAAISLAKSADVPGSGSPPVSASFAFMPASAKAACTALFSSSTISAGVPFGTPMPVTALAS